MKSDLDNACPAWKYLEPGWASKEFLLSVVEERECEENAKDLAERMVMLANAVEPIFDKAVQGPV